MTVGRPEPWKMAGMSKFAWGMQQRQRRAQERFAKGGTHEQKFGHPEGEYWQKRSFVEIVLERAQQFVSQKRHNQAQITFIFNLDGDLADTYPLLSPALVKVKITNVGKIGTEQRCQWRVADAAGELSSGSDSVEMITASPRPSSDKCIAGFLESHFGVNVYPHISHYPEVTSMQARIVLGEPLGTLAIIEGDSRRIIHNQAARSIDLTKCLIGVPYHRFLCEE